MTEDTYWASVIAAEVVGIVGLITSVALDGWMVGVPIAYILTLSIVLLSAGRLW